MALIKETDATHYHSQKQRPNNLSKRIQIMLQVSSRVIHDINSQPPRQSIL